MCAVSITMRLFVVLLWAGGLALGTWRVRVAMPFRGTDAWPAHRRDFQLGLILIVLAMGMFLNWIAGIRRRRSAAAAAEVTTKRKR